MAIQLEPDRTNEAAYTIAEEVSASMSSMPMAAAAGSASGIATHSSAASTGPPRAVKITLTLQFPVSKGGEPITKSLVQVIPIRTGPGIATVTLVDPVVPTDAEYRHGRRHERLRRRWFRERAAVVLAAEEAAAVARAVGAVVGRVEAVRAVKAAASAVVGKAAVSAVACAGR